MIRIKLMDELRAGVPLMSVVDAEKSTGQHLELVFLLLVPGTAVDVKTRVSENNERAADCGLSWRQNSEIRSNWPWVSPVR